MGRVEIMGQEHARFEVSSQEGYDDLCRLADFYARELLGDRPYARHLDVSSEEEVTTMDGVTTMVGWRATVDLYWDRDGGRS